MNKSNTEQPAIWPRKWVSKDESKKILEETYNWDTLIYRDKLGRCIESDELDVLLRHPEYKVVKQEKVGPYFISTVWLGVPYGLGWNQPHYFETMVFLIPEGVKDPKEKLGEGLEIYRYHNIIEAEAGHEEVVKEWKQK